MNEESDGQRHSIAQSADLISDPVEKAERESRNALEQFDRGVAVVLSYLEGQRPFRLRLSLVLDLHRQALKGLSEFAGNFRPAQVEIKGSGHEPPGAHLVPELVEEMCDYVNDHWTDATPIHLAAYVMWRLNWIHPFADGNGRTSRILSYVVLCLRLGYVLPGAKTIPEQITENRNPYFEALDAADDSFAEGRIDVSKMENLLADYLSNQLYAVTVAATGRDPANDGQ